MKKLAYLFIPILLLSCRKDKTSWNSDWRFPILSDTLNMKNWVKDSILSENPDGSYQLVINRDLLNLRLDSIIKIPDTTIRQKVALKFPSVTLSPGTSFINQVENHQFNIEDVQLKKVILSSGEAEVTLKSPIKAATILTLTLPGVTKSGVTYSKTVNMPAGTPANPSVFQTHLDIKGYTVDLTGDEGNSYNTIQSQLIVKTDPNGNAVTVTNTDTIVVDVFFHDLRPNYARGYFGNLIFDDTTTVDLDLLNNITDGAIDVQNSNFTLTVSNGIKVTARTKFTLVEGISASQNSVALTHPGIGSWRVINQASGTWDNLQPTIIDWVFDDVNSNISPFIENLPQTVKLGYALEMNPLGNESGGWNEYFSTSRLRISLKANMPLAIGMSNLTYCDTFDLTLQQNIDKTHVESGQLMIKADNAYPFSAKLQIIALNTNDEVIFTKTAPNKIQGSGSLNNYNPLEKVHSEVLFSLSEDEVSKMNQMKRLAIKVIFDTPSGGQVAKIYDNQFIYLQVFSNLKLINKL